MNFIARGDIDELNRVRLLTRDQKETNLTQEITKQRLTQLTGKFSIYDAKRVRFKTMKNLKLKSTLCTLHFYNLYCTYTLYTLYTLQSNILIF